MVLDMRERDERRNRRALLRSEGSGGSEMERMAFCISLAMIGFFLRLCRRGLFSMHSLLVCFICLFSLLRLLMFVPFVLLLPRVSSDSLWMMNGVWRRTRSYICPVSVFSTTSYSYCRCYNKRAFDTNTLILDVQRMGSVLYSLSTYSRPYSN